MMGDAISHRRLEARADIPNAASPMKFMHTFSDLASIAPVINAMLVHKARDFPQPRYDSCSTTGARGHPPLF